MSGLVLFDDGGGRMQPVCDLRPVFELRSGALSTSERIAEAYGAHAVALIVPDELAALTASRHTEPINRLPDAGDSFMFINGRWTRINADLPQKINTALIDEDGSIVAALLDFPHAEQFVTARCRTLNDVSTMAISGANLMTRPWHVLRAAQENLPGDLEILAKRLKPLDGDPAPRVTVVGKHSVLVGNDATIHPHVVFDTSGGPIAIDDGAEVRSMSVLVGPTYVGRGAVICNHAHIRGRCIIGPVCKVGGEVNASVFQGHSNKAHSGYVGNSFIGEWVNLGADTVTSNLKNTYGEIRVQQTPDGPAEPTGTQYLGSIIGDHVKTAIGTRLLTGSVLGTGAMLAVAGFPPKCVRRFAFITDEGEQRYDLTKFCEVAAVMMGRRDVALEDALRRRLSQLYGQPD